MSYKNISLQLLLAAMMLVLMVIADVDFSFMMVTAMPDHRTPSGPIDHTPHISSSDMQPSSFLTLKPPASPIVRPKNLKSNPKYRDVTQHESPSVTMVPLLVPYYPYKKRGDNALPAALTAAQATNYVALPYNRYKREKVEKENESEDILSRRRWSPHPYQVKLNLPTE
ncbi:hypothetical protein FBU30_005325 [Linnemannia zychae]|nr:hypothetical protein FBU30_005325 [Linnemannia zychae]